MFLEDSGNIKNDLEMHPGGRNEGFTLVVVDESSKLTLFIGGGQFVDGKEDMGVVIEETCKGPTNDDIILEGFAEEHHYPSREQQLLNEWWKNHIFPQHGEE